MNAMMNLNLDPWGFLEDIIDTSSRTFKSMRARAAGRFPPVNVYLDDNAVLIDLELPGKTAKDVELSLEPQAVVIADRLGAAQKPQTYPAEILGDDGKTAEKRSAPAWSRRVELPFRVNAEKANAKFANGILRIELPRAEASGVKKIAIQ